MRTKIKQLLYRLQTKWRISRNLCPVCNSDAPKLDKCWLCKGSREYPLSQKRKELYIKEMGLEMKAWKGIDG